MDGKIAAIAITLIVAVPILLGYGMAFQDVEKSYYVDDESKNVTDYLLNSTEYTYTSANTYTTNGRVWDSTAMDPYRFYPEYRTIGDTYTSLPIGVMTSIPATVDLTQYSYFYIDTNLSAYDAADCVMMSANTISVAKPIKTINYYYPDFGEWTYFNIPGTGTAGGGLPTGTTTLTFDTSAYTSTPTIYYMLADGTANKYANYVDGYNPYVVGGLSSNSMQVDFVTCNAGIYSSEVIVTADLESLTAIPSGGDKGIGFRISASSYVDSDVNSLKILARLVVKEVDGVWTINGTEMVRSAESGKNVWQFIIKNGEITANYVGSWPNVGLAYPLQSIKVSYASEDADADVRAFTIGKVLPSSDERVRVDAATQRSSPYSVISNNTYDPTIFNGSADKYSTTLTNVGLAGSSLEFAGETYNVVNRSLQIGSKQVPLNGLRMSSEKQADNTYDNYIGGIQVASTAAPSTIVFNGSWSPIVQTAYSHSETSTSTEWVPGEFAWNGVDQSFALVGLITCVGAFVGLGMYGRRSGAKVGTLMVICGCAAFVFLALL